MNAVFYFRQEGNERISLFFEKQWSLSEGNKKAVQYFTPKDNEDSPFFQTRI